MLTAKRDFLSTPQAAKAAGVTATTVANWVRRYPGLGEDELLTAFADAYPTGAEVPMRGGVVAVKLERDEKAALAAAARDQSRTLAGMMRAATLDWLRRAGHLPPVRDQAEGGPS
jgi:hypothetical protein